MSHRLSLLTDIEYHWSPSIIISHTTYIALMNTQLLVLLIHQCRYHSKNTRMLNIAHFEYELIWQIWLFLDKTYPTISYSVHMYITLVGNPLIPSMASTSYLITNWNNFLLTIINSHKIHDYWYYAYTSSNFIYKLHIWQSIITHICLYYTHIHIYLS